METINKFEQQRLQKLQQIKQLGIDPYGSRFDQAESAEDIRAGFKDDGNHRQAGCAGRIVLLRDIGKLIFITLRDSSGTIQIGLSKKHDTDRAQ
jgi:lysyl-tRNA synthetase class 2